MSHAPQKVWVYNGRHGEVEAFYSFADARAVQDTDNRITLQEIIDHESDVEWGGSEEEGNFWIDDGGTLTQVEIQ